MMPPLDVPPQVLQATLADGRTVGWVTGGRDPGYVRDDSYESLATFRQNWETRRDVDIPIWLELGTINGATARAWRKRVTSMLHFVERNRGGPFRMYLFPPGPMVLFACDSGMAFVIDLPERRRGKGRWWAT